jgi:23S rRNA pseudouridine1911/1915/1917 synthase
VTPPRAQDRGAPTLLGLLRAEGHRVWAVHRLDRETSGVCLFAKSPGARNALMEAFRGKAVRKWYLAIVAGHPRPPSGVVKAPIEDHGAIASVSPRGLPAETRFRTLERAGACALLELELVTGRHNQARLHCALLGHPLVGERKYAFGRDAVLRHKRAALHAARVEIVLPWSGRRVIIEAPMPPDLERLLDRARASDSSARRGGA